LTFDLLGTKSISYRLMVSTGMSSLQYVDMDIYESGHSLQRTCRGHEEATANPVIGSVLIRNPYYDPAGLISCLTQKILWKFAHNFFSFPAVRTHTHTHTHTQRTNKPTRLHDLLGRGSSVKNLRLVISDSGDLFCYCPYVYLCMWE